MATFAFKLKYNKEFDQLLGPAKMEKIDEFRKKTITEYYSREPEELTL